MVQEREEAYPRDARRRHAHDRRGSARATRRRRWARQKYARDPKKYARGMRDARDRGPWAERKNKTHRFNERDETLGSPRTRRRCVEFLLRGLWRPGTLVVVAGPTFASRRSTRGGCHRELASRDPRVLCLVGRRRGGPGMRGCGRSLWDRFEFNRRGA